jgi:transposase
MEQWIGIRRQVLVEGVSKRQILKETGMHWTTLEKILSYDSPPGYRRSKPPQKPKLDPYLDRIVQIIEQDKHMPKKQRHTAKRIWQRLCEEGFEGGYTIVKDAVRELKRHSGELFMPLCHVPGEAQVDFGHAVANVGGVFRKVVFFVMALQYSDAFFVRVFERECTETLCEGHVRGFEFFGGVPTRITYDNSKICISKIIGSRARRLTQGFGQLVSHYLFQPHFCLVQRANEKGVVEGIVKYARLNFLVPVPQVRDLEELNEHLVVMCRNDLKRRLRGKVSRKEQLLSEDQAAFLPLPAVGFDACRRVSGRVNSELLVRFDSNDYSAPIEYAHHQVVVKGYTDRVELCCFNEVVAVHARCWEKERQIFDPLHYLPLLERKPGALDHGLPFSGWMLPECFSTLRGRLEHERDDGTREYIGVLGLFRKYRFSDVRRAVEKGLKIRAHTRDAIAQFLLPQEPWEQTSFTLDGRDHLRHVKVSTCDLSAYRSLLSTGGVV